MSIPAILKSVLRPAAGAIRRHPALYLGARLTRVALQHGFREAGLRYRVLRYEETCEKKADDTPLLMYHEFQAQRDESKGLSVHFSLVCVLREAPEERILSLVQSVISQSYQNWNLLLLDQRNSPHDSPALGKLIRDHSGIRLEKADPGLSRSRLFSGYLSADEIGYFAVIDERAFLHPSALHSFAKEIDSHACDFLFSDELSFTSRISDARNPFYKPEYSPDTLRSYNYIGAFFAFAAGLYRSVSSDGAADNDSSYDLILRLCEKASRPHRIPELLCFVQNGSEDALGLFSPDAAADPEEYSALEAHLRRIGLAGTVVPGSPPFLHRIEYEIRGTPLVSILIPSRDHLDDLKKCVDSILHKTTWTQWEILILENGSRQPETLEYYQSLSGDSRIRVLNWTGTFNFAAVCNFGAGAARGDYLLLLNNDTEVISPDWLQEMLMYAQRGDVGAVGARLLYPDGTIQHAGIIIDPTAISFHVLRHTASNEPGYAWRLRTVQNLSAVTGACLMVRHALWDQAGGMDEEFTVTYNDADFCMKMLALGLRNVWTPHAALYHHEFKSRGTDTTPEKAARKNREKELFENHWRKDIEAGDPAHSPRLAGISLSYGAKPPWP